MTSHRSPAAAALLLTTSGGANAKLLLLEPAPVRLGARGPTVFLVPGTSRSVHGHRPVIMVPSNAPAGHLPGCHHPLVQAQAAPVASMPVVQATLVAAVPATVMTPALWPQQAPYAVGPSLAPDAFQTRLDVQQARPLATCTLQRFPGIEIEATWDVGFYHRTVQHRLSQTDNGDDISSGGAAGGGRHGSGHGVHDSNNGGHGGHGDNGYRR